MSADIAEQIEIVHHGKYRQRNIMVGLVNGGIVYFIYIPLILYFVFRFWKSRNAPYLQNRYPTLTLISTLSVVAVLFFASWSALLYINVEGFTQKYLLIILSLIIMSAAVFTNATVCRIWLLYFTVRVNKANLNDKWQSIINPNQNIQENPCPMDNANAFYLQHRATFGNYHYMKQKMLKLILFDVIITIFAFAMLILLRAVGVKPDIVKIIFIVYIIGEYLAMFLLPLFFILYIYRLIPEFYDNLGLRDELKFTARVFLISVLLHFFMIAAFSMDQVEDDRSEREDGMWGIWYLMLDFQISAILFTMNAIAMIKYYPDKLAKLYNISRDPSNGQISKTNTNSYSRTNTVDYQNLSDHERKLQKLKIRDILKHNDIFQIFIEHLAHEFCMESFLSIIEITQYRDYILFCEPELKQKYNANHGHDVVSSRSLVSTLAYSPTTPSTPSITPMTSVPTLSIDGSETVNRASVIGHNNNNIHQYYQLPAEVIKSDIVYPEYYKANKKGDMVCRLQSIEEYMKDNMIEDKQERIKRYKEMAYAIFDKYVRIGAEFEINVAFATRAKYMSLMGNKEVWLNEMTVEMDENELGRLFEDCYDEMIRLMAHSFGRFKRTEKFEKAAAVLV